MSFLKIQFKESMPSAYTPYIHALILGQKAFFILEHIINIQIEIILLIS